MPTVLCCYSSGQSGRLWPAELETGSLLLCGSHLSGNSRSVCSRPDEMVRDKGDRISVTLSGADVARWTHLQRKLGFKRVNTLAKYLMDRYDMCEAGKCKSPEVVSWKEEDIPGFRRMSRDDQTSPTFPTGETFGASEPLAVDTREAFPSLLHDVTMTSPTYTTQGARQRNILTPSQSPPAVSVVQEASVTTNMGMVPVKPHPGIENNQPIGHYGTDGFKRTPVSMMERQPEDGRPAIIHITPESDFQNDHQMFQSTYNQNHMNYSDTTVNPAAPRPPHCTQPYVVTSGDTIQYVVPQRDGGTASLIATTPTVAKQGYQKQPYSSDNFPTYEAKPAPAKWPIYKNYSVRHTKQSSVKQRKLRPIRSKEKLQQTNTDTCTPNDHTHGGYLKPTTADNIKRGCKTTENQPLYIPVYVDPSLPQGQCLIKYLPPSSEGQAGTEVLGPATVVSSQSAEDPMPPRVKQCSIGTVGALSNSSGFNDDQENIVPKSSVAFWNFGKNFQVDDIDRNANNKSLPNRNLEKAADVHPENVNGPPNECSSVLKSLAENDGTGMQRRRSRKSTNPRFCPKAQTEEEEPVMNVMEVEEVRGSNLELSDKDNATHKPEFEVMHKMTEQVKDADHADVMMKLRKKLCNTDVILKLRKKLCNADFMVKLRKTLHSIDNKEESKQPEKDNSTYKPEFEFIPLMTEQVKETGPLDGNNKSMELVLQKQCEEENKKLQVSPDVRKFDKTDDDNTTQCEEENKKLQVSPDVRKFDKTDDDNTTSYGDTDMQLDSNNSSPVSHVGQSEAEGPSEFSRVPIKSARNMADDKNSPASARIVSLELAFQNHIARLLQNNLSDRQVQNSDFPTEEGKSGDVVPSASCNDGESSGVDQSAYFTIDKKIQCFICYQTFPHRQAFRRHIRRHMGKDQRKKFDHLPQTMCEYCESKYFSFEEQLHDDCQASVCTVEGCNVLLTTKANFLKHQEKHRVKMWHITCSICGESVKESTFQNHLAKHETPVECDICLKVFSSKNALRTHSLIHTDTRNYKCVHCDVSFVQKSSWNYHMIKKHPEDRSWMRENASYNVH